VTPDVAYLVFGTVLVVALGAIAAFYYSGKRKGHVERAKYKMLDDDD
jgi:hypothetical protein